MAYGKKKAPLPKKGKVSNSVPAKPSAKPMAMKKPGAKGLPPKMY